MSKPLRFVLIVVLSLSILPLLGLSLVVLVVAPPQITAVAFVLLGLLGLWLALRKKQPAGVPSELSLLPGASSKGNLL